MLTLADELRDRRRLLTGLQFDQSDHRVGSLWVWLQEQQEFQGIKAEIDAQLNLRALLATHGMHSPPKAGTREEIVAVGFHLMEQCSRGRDLGRTAMGLGIYPPYSTGGHIQPHVDAAMESFVNPALDYVAERLEAAPRQPSADDLLRQRIGQVVSPRFIRSYPETAQRLREMAGEFGRAEEGYHWNNVGNSCRSALQAFASELTVRFEVDLPPDVKRGDVKGAVSAVLAAKMSKGRFRRSLRDLLMATWDHAASIVHRDATTKREAQRLFAWTALTIVELAGALDTKA